MVAVGLVEYAVARAALPLPPRRPIWGPVRVCRRRRRRHQPKRPVCHRRRHRRRRHHQPKRPVCHRHDTRRGDEGKEHGHTTELHSLNIIRLLLLCGGIHPNPGPSSDSSRSGSSHPSDFDSTSSFDSSTTDSTSETETGQQSSTEQQSSESATTFIVSRLSTRDEFNALSRLQQRQFANSVREHYNDNGSNLSHVQHMRFASTLLDTTYEATGLHLQGDQSASRSTNARTRDNTGSTTLETHQLLQCQRCGVSGRSRRNKTCIECHKLFAQCPTCTRTSGANSKKCRSCLEKSLCQFCSTPTQRTRMCVNCRRPYHQCYDKNCNRSPAEQSNKCRFCLENSQICGVCNLNIESKYDRKLQCSNCAKSLHFICFRDHHRLCNTCSQAGVLCCCCQQPIELLQLTTCSSCYRPNHQACQSNGKCTVCIALSTCHRCNEQLSYNDARTCTTCERAVHFYCTIGQRCIPCNEAYHAVAPPVHSLPQLFNCRYCQARQFLPNRTFCCSGGSHILDQDAVKLTSTVGLFFLDNEKLLISHGREINQLASFTSIGVKNTQTSYGGIQQRHNDTCFAQIEGKIYHFGLFSLGKRSHPLLGCATSFLFHQTGTSTTFTDRFTPEVVAAAQQYRTLMCRVNEHVAKLRETYGVVPSTHDFYTFVQNTPQSYITVDGNMDNSTTSRSQLTLLYSVAGDVFQRPETTTLPHSTDIFYLQCGDSRYESMSYPLFDVTGQHGWFKAENCQVRASGFELTTRELPYYSDTEGKKLTLRQYVQYNFCQNQIHCWVPKLQQEWLLDQISRAESIQEPWIVNHMMKMDKMRTATLREFTRNPNTQTTGHRSRIPSTVRGSQSYRRDKVDLGMAHVYEYGPPTLFITMTANPAWPEIVNNLRPGQQWHHDVYLVNLVFREKLLHLIEGLKAGKYFNNRKSQWIQYSIEFQKRGLPHAHILVRLEGDQPQTAVEVDALSTVNFPLFCSLRCGTCRQCTLAHLVNTHMTHKCFPDRCFKTHRPLPKGERPHCKYGYPWISNPVSHLGPDGKWVLRRRTQESNIVEYNPELLLTYQCHINVQVTTGSKCILYLRKYMSKGPDVANVRISHHMSCQMECNSFYQTRCMTASEAGWTALGFNFQHYDPPVKLLKLHLQHEETVSFQEDDDPDKVMQKFKKPQLEVYFERSPQFTNETFQQYFSKVDVTASGNEKVRLSKIITAINTVRFQDSEHFSLYLLLKTLKPRSWQEIKGESQTFTERAQSLGILGCSQQEFHRLVLNEMRERHESSENFMRYFIFVVMDTPRCFNTLFSEFWDKIIDGRTLFSSKYFTRRAALLQMRLRFMQEGCTLSELLKDATEDIIAEINALPDVNEAELNTFFNVSVNFLPLDLDQQRTLDDIIRNSCSQPQLQNLFYINGCAGSGKTHLLRQIARHLAENQHNVCCCASTGIAASLLPNGFTCHKLFKMPVNDEYGGEVEFSTLLDAGSRDVNARLLRSCTVLIVDEISMIHKKQMELMDKTLRLLCDSELPFAGKIVIFAGDFNQQATVLKGNIPPELMASRAYEASIKFAKLFEKFTRYTLNKAHRFQDQSWADFLLKTIAHGTGSKVANQPNTTTVPQFLPHHGVKFISSSQLASFVETQADFSEPSPVQYISTKHELVRRFNKRQTEAYYDESEITVFPARYSYSPDANKYLHHEQLRHIHVNNMPDDELHLAVGMPVMCMRNLNIRDGLCNGAIGTIHSLDATSIELKLQSTGKIMRIPRISFPISSSLIGKGSLIRHQFPLVPAFAITVSKSQGKTFSQSLIIDLSEQCFGHGQLYVALSRSTAPTNITVVIDTNPINGVENVVFPELTVL